MKELFSLLPGDIHLSQVNIPGTHDSCTAFCTMENVARCQSLTISQQLDMGIRLFDLRLGKKKGRYFLVHSLATCFSDKEKSKVLFVEEVLDAFKKFLRENPREVIIVSIKQDRGIMSRFFFEKLYKEIILADKDMWYLENDNPLLSSCRGKMVLMRRCKLRKGFKQNQTTGIDFSFWPDQSGKKKISAESFPLSLDSNKRALLTAHIQDRYSLEPDVKWHSCAKPFLDACVPDKENISLSFISTSFRYKGKTIKETAQKLNSFFTEYELKKEKAQGWMLFDFPTQQLIDKVIASNFEIYKEN